MKVLPPPQAIVPGAARAVALTLAVVALLVAGASTAGAQTNDIFTAVGTGTPGFSGDGGAASAAQLNLPVDVEALAGGGYLVTDQGNARVRRVAADGTISTVAGNGTAGFSGDGGPATAAQLDTPNGVAATPDGGFLIADSNSHRVRRVAADGTISTVAGTGVPGFSGDGGPATAAQLSFPDSVAVLPGGGYLISDNDNHRVRRVAADGTISTVAGIGTPGFAGDGGLATSAQLNDPGGLAVTPDGGYLIADINNHRVRRVAADGTITTVAGTGTAGFAGDGQAASAAQLSSPIDVAVTPDGGYLIVDRANHRLRSVTPEGVIASVAGTGTAGFAGDGSPASAAQLNLPVGVAVTGDGDELIADTLNHRVRFVDTGAAGAPPQAPPPPPPPPPPAPDFFLTYGEGIDPGNPTVALSPGGEATFPLVLVRNAGSNGRVRLSVDGLPAGVTADFSPAAELEGTAAGRLTMTVRAAADAAPFDQPIEIIATPVDPTAGPRQRSVDAQLIVQGHLAVKVEGIEVTQAVQTYDQPSHQIYNGVPLLKHKRTVVRVFADLQGREAVGGAGSRPPFGMALFATDSGGRPLPGSPVFPEWAPSVAGLALNDAYLTAAERNSATSAFTFVLPDAWTLGSLRLEARAVGSSSSNPSSPSPSTLCLTAACGASPSATLGGIAFRDPPPAAALSVLEQPVVLHQDHKPDLPVTGISTIKATPAQIFQKLQALSPVPFHFFDANDRPADWPRFRATRFASDSAIWEPADAFDEAIGRPGLAMVGVYVLEDNPGVTIGHTSVVSARTLDSGALWRPVTSVAHEVFHRLGFAHASKSCGAGDGEDWPVPDGRMDSVGIDTTPGSGTGSAPYRIIADTDANPTYDLMGYCGITSGDAPHWISARNWNRALGVAPPAPPRLPWVKDARVVRGQVLGGIVKILSVTPPKGPPPSDPGPSPYVLVAHDVAGTVLASVPFKQYVGLGAGGAEPVVSLEGRVPSKGVARVDVVDAGGAVVATRSASAAAPSVRFLSPRRGGRVGERGTVAVRWRASDADGDALDATLDVSADGGRTFHNIWGGPSGDGTARLPVERLDATDDARLRLRVTDGFNETTTTSARFVVVGRRPRVQILEPTPNQRADAGGAARLRGAAVDDGGRQLKGKRLRWLAGRTVLGRGTTVSAALPAGTRRIRLEATDAAGRTGFASVAVSVRPTTPFFLRLAAPRIARSARVAVLVVAATQPSTLTVRGRRYGVGPTSRRIRVAVGAGRSAIPLRLTLAAGGRRSVSTVVVRRR